MKYCINCKQLVDPQKKFNAIVFIILLFTLVGWVLYLIYYTVKPKKCPMCNSTNWGVKPQETLPSQTQPIYRKTPSRGISIPIEESKYCSQCGEKIGNNVQFCSLCGAKQ